MAEPTVKRPAPQGASSQRVSWQDRGRSYLHHHRQVAAESLRRLRTAPLNSLMTLLVMAIALSLPGLLYVGLSNAQSLSHQWQGEGQISLYLQPGLDSAAGEDLAQQLRANAQVETLSYLSPDDALAEFQQFSGFGEALDQLQANPLPAVILVTPSPEYRRQPALEQLRQLLGSVDGVAEAQSDQAWVARLNQIIALGERITGLLAVLLATAVVLVVGNTIRLEIENRREEILVVKLVGGTDAFVRRPFLYSGFCYGLFSGVLAWGLILAGLWLLSEPVGALVSLYEGSFAPAGFGPLPGLVLVFISALMGVLGAWIAVVRHLHAIEPR
ncbi:permease-like cell division protein FtsX [Motiliproteus sp. SC1-56]|uniref:permease-like cell division protein FtsX n=1 Tax=Motiliproteus sp. SC1-56 TaxID=2799565 RepID=UPI001A8F93B7|nr:permease-like cell division protein FtsX [Motiliproteus sp. SC1-56]